MNQSITMNKLIAGVIITPLRKIPDDRGTIMQMMRCDQAPFLKFGEIYFSTVFPGIVKGWHIHTEMTLNYAVIKGSIKMVLYDDRDDSQTKGMINEFVIGRDNYSLVTIPPLVWNGFMGIGIEEAIVANCSTVPHRSDEINRCDPHDSNIPYSWAIKDR